MNDRQRVVNVAMQYKGYNEANGSHRVIIDKYNANRPKGGYMMTHQDPWCAAFASVCFVEAGLSDLMPPNCSCEQLINNFKKLGAWQEDGTVTPQVGDVIFYNWDKTAQPNDGWSDHVGIVTGVSGGFIKVIEGNYSDSVKERTIALGNGLIRGFGLPHYKVETVSKSVDAVAKEVIQGKWGNGEARKMKLTDAGYNYIEVQKRVNELLK